MSRTILVTGGGTGIGRACAHHFAAQGEQVIVTGRRPGPLAEAAAHDGVRALECDHTDPAALTRLLAALPERIDVLVNNAGGNTDFDADGEQDLAAYARDFRANLDANLVGAALTTRALDGRRAARWCTSAPSPPTGEPAPTVRPRPGSPPGTPTWRPRWARAM